MTRPCPRCSTSIDELVKRGFSRFCSNCGGAGIVQDDGSPVDQQTYLSANVHQACADIAEEIGGCIKATEWQQGQIKEALKKLAGAIIQQVKDTR